MTNDLLVTIFKPIIPYVLVLISIEIVNLLVLMIFYYRSNYYKKMHNFNTARLQYNEIYSDIIVGPVPHSMENLDGESSLVAAIQKHPEMYPKLGLASSNNSLKLTMSNFRELLTETRYFQEAV